MPVSRALSKGVKLVFHGLAGGFAVERFLDEAETGDLLAMAGDDDFLPVLSEI
jgi:hypothetical protein